mgnify:CR=1 FL=1
MVKGWTLLVVAIAAALIFLRGWPGLGRQRTKERTAFLLLLGLGVLLAAFLRYFPGAPGPTDLVEAMFRPLAEWMGL